MRKEIEKGQKLNLLEDDGEDFDDEFAAKEAKLSQYEKKAEYDFASFRLRFSICPTLEFCLSTEEELEFQ